MWIIPKNLQLSAFVPDMVESREDLSLLESELESSLFWRSKPSRLRTWSLRWNRVSWLRHLFTRILKPSQQATFAEKWTSSLEDIHVNRSQLLGKGLGKKTHDTCGRTSSNTSEQLTLFDVSGKTSQATSIEDSKKSSKTWKEKATEQRGEYSQRLKSAQGIEEKESSSWATPNTLDHLPQRSPEALRKQATTSRKGRKRPSNLREQVNPEACRIYSEVDKWPTPTVSDHKGSGKTVIRKDGKDRRKDRLDYATEQAEGAVGKLNPQWVEWLMGLPIGLTDLGCWGTE